MLLGISHVRGQPERTGAALALADRYIVSASYFSAIGVRLLAGRVLTDADRENSPAVCVIDEVFARRVFGSQNPIGQRMEISGRADYAEIVGVVSHVKTVGLDADSPGQIYVSSEQFPWRWSSVVIRTAGDPTAVAAAVRGVVRQLDPNQPVTRVASMESLMTEMLRTRRFTLLLLAAFAGAAIALAAVGLYGVIAYGVTQRGREFGVRLALGAKPSQVTRLILFEGGRITAVGVLIGIAGALAASRALASLLFEVSTHDASGLAIVVAGLAAISLMACWLPARRAARIDPASTLRSE